MGKYGDAMYWSAQNYIISSKYDVAESHARKAVNVFQDDTTETGRKKYIQNLVWVMLYSANRNIRRH